MRRLFILQPKEDQKEWTPWYDKTFGVVVRADTIKLARELASKVAGDEGKEVWLDNKKTTCRKLSPEGRPGVVLVDHASA